MSHYIKDSVLSAGLTRQEFLRVTGKGLAGLAISPVLLNIMGCTQEEVNSGTVDIVPTANGLIRVKRARCTGCGRCELACTTYNDGYVGVHFSRVKITPAYQFGDHGVGSGGGMYGDISFTTQTCRQCKEAECYRVCPVRAIEYSEEQGCLVVNRKRCIGCHACTTACPWAMATVNPRTEKSGKCVLCGECVAACPTGALATIAWEEITV